MKRLILLLVVGIFLINFGSAVELYEWYDTNDDQTFAPTGNTIGGQNFTVGAVGENSAFTVLNLSLKLIRVGSPGQVDVSIVGQKANGEPNMADIKVFGFIDGNAVPTTAGGTWTNITMNSTSFSASAGETYFIVYNVSSGDGANYVGWRQDESSPTYPGGNKTESADNGDTWTSDTRTQMFRVWGEEIIRTTQNEPTPTNNEQVLLGDIIFNVTNNGLGNQLRNTSLWINGTLNQTISFTDIINTSYFTKTFTTLGAREFYFNTCDNRSICVNTSARVMDVQNWVEHATYSPPTALVGNTENFGTQFNLSSGTSITSATFMYNGVGYPVTTTGLGSNNYNLTKNFNIPATTGSIQNYFNATLSTGEKINGTASAITISSLVIDSCGVYTNELYNFTMYDEQTLTNINVDPAINTTTTNATLNLQIYDSTKTISVINYSTEYTNSTSFRVCLQNTLTASSGYIIDLELHYFADGYAKEYYNIFGDTLTSADLGTQIGLYDLINTSSTEFELTYRDSSYLPVENAVVQVSRKYGSEGVFRTVEQPKTDANGQTLLHLEVDDAIYTFTIIKDGQISAVFDNIKAVCQNPTFNDCTLDLTNVESYIKPIDFATFEGFTFIGPTFNKTTREIATTFFVLSGSSELVSLNVTLFDSLGSTDVCSSAVTTSSGSLFCTIPLSFGNSTVIATLYKDGVKIAQNIVSLAQDPQDLYGDNLVWVGFIVFIGLLGLGISGNPIVMGLFLVLTSILLITMNVIYSTTLIGAGSTILWFILAVVLIVIKGANRI